MTPMLMQSEAAECGLACLAMVMGHHGYTVDLGTLRRRFPISLRGTTLDAVLSMAERVGLMGRGLQLNADELHELRLPAILHWDLNHFVVLVRVRGATLTIHDPAYGMRRYTLDEADKHFTGIALELSPTAAFERRTDRTSLPLATLVGPTPGLRSGLFKAFALSGLLQIAVLAGPLYMQLAVDEAVLTDDRGLLIALAAGFGLLTFIHIAADWLRAQVLLALGSLIGFQMVANLFHHMLRLPLDWFEKRHIGDLVTRFGSTRPIRDLIAEGLVAAVVDGLMAILTLVMIFIYSPLLAAIVLVSLVFYAMVRVAAYRVLRQRQEEQIVAMAKEQSSFIESARAIQTIKIFGRERDREELWQNRFAQFVNQTVRLKGLEINFKTVNDLLYGAENILVVYVGARLAMDGHMTIGMLFAFMSYKQQFLDKATRLLETAIEYRMLDLHLDRIADIALSDREKGLEVGFDTLPLVPHQLRGGIELRNVSYRYAETEPDVLSGIHLIVEPGEFVAITGPSGGGKTTLLKVMLGLFHPREGEVLVDGVPLDHVGPKAFRAQVGVVMQDDQLLSGSLAENIALFAATFDTEHIRQCAALAGIDHEIMAMPMNYNTLVGDMGTGLSGGQRQRVLLARALYRKPRILLMDEGTSHLDVSKEREVNRNIAALGMTRIVIAHRPETIAAADRWVELRDGRLSSMDATAITRLSLTPAV